METDFDRTTTRPHRHPSPGGGGNVGGGREDCWSEGATAVLIEAWGDRHLRSNRRKLRHSDWKEVADAVNGSDNGAKQRKTDVQCKHRIDTLKKKYKVEKAKVFPPSNWRFFSRMDYLVGGDCSSKRASPALAVSFPLKPSRKFRLNPNPNSVPDWSHSLNPKGNAYRSISLESSESSLGGSQDEGDEVLSVGGEKKRGMECIGFSEEEMVFRELARAILKFGEIYEKVETSKQQQMMELERQRMEFTRELEIQKMNMLMEAQLELNKLKRHKNGTAAGEKL
ncbi:hypothetical protein Dimus_033385 [Dionaea muscipula]